jgi:hypothetical protein
MSIKHITHLILVLALLCGSLFSGSDAFAQT